MKFYCPSRFLFARHHINILCLYLKYITMCNSIAWLFYVWLFLHFAPLHLKLVPMPPVPSASLAARCCITPISCVVQLQALRRVTYCCFDQFPLRARTCTCTDGPCHANSGTGAASFTQESAHLFEWSPPSVSAAALPDMEVTRDCKTVGVREKSVFSNNQSSSVPKKHARTQTHKHTRTHREYF